jgi:hypothetical protein
MYLQSVTVATTNVPQKFIPKAVQPSGSHQVQSVLFFNNGVNNIYLGDKYVSLSPINYIPIFPSGSDNAAPPLSYGSNDLDEWWFIGTAGDVLTAQIFP